MSKETLPKVVALPDVSKYTEDVVFGNLALPVGFDDERLLVHLRSFGRVRSTAGLGTVTIGAYRGDSTRYDYDVTAMDLSGTATMGGTVKREPGEVSRGNLTFHHGGTLFGKPDANIEVNLAESEAAIKEKHGDAGLFDPSLQAKQLNKAIKSELFSTVLDANMDKEKAKVALKYYGLFGGLILVGGGSPARGMLIAAAFGPVMWNLQTARVTTEQNYRQNTGLDWKDGLRLVRQSLFVGLTPDRWLAGVGSVATSRFITAQK